MRFLKLAALGLVLAGPAALMSAETAEAQPGWRHGHHHHHRGWHRGPPRWAPAHGWRRKHHHHRGHHHHHRRW